MEKTNLSVKLGANLKRLRKLRSLTVEAFASLVDESPDSIRHYERGDRPLSVEKLYSYAIALDADPQSLLLDLDPRKPSPPLKGEVHRLSADDSAIMRKISTEWQGDIHALCIAVGLYAALPPESRREVVMSLRLESDKALQSGTLSISDLPPNLSYLEQQHGSLYL